MFFRALQELGRREGTILTAGPGGRKNPLMTPEARERIRRNYRRFDDRDVVDVSAFSQEQQRSSNARTESTILTRGLTGDVREPHRIRVGNDREKPGAGLAQNVGLLVGRNNNGDDAANPDQECPDLSPQIENVKATIKDIEELIESRRRKIQETEAEISDIEVEIAIIRIQLGLSITGGLLKLIAPARIPGIIASAAGAGKTMNDLNQKEHEHGRAQSKLSAYQDQLNEAEKRLAKRQKELEGLQRRQKECRGGNNGDENGDKRA